MRKTRRNPLENVREIFMNNDVVENKIEILKK